MEKIILPNGTPGRILTPDDLVVEQAAMTANAINSALMPDNFDYTHSPSDNEMAAMEFKNPRQVNELKYIIKDILSGDQAAAKDERYSYLNFKQIKTAIEWIQNNNFDEDLQALLVSQPWKLVYKTKPPTPEEFLTNKYIGAMADNLFLPVKKNFLEFFDPIKPYRNAYLNPSIGAGKSTFTMMSLLYVACLYALMRDPWKFFSKAKTTIFAITLCAVTITKAKEIYEEPIRQLIESADFWKQCRTHSEMMEEEKHLQECDEVEYIPWKNGPQPLDSKVYLPDGSFKYMKDVKVGDVIASPTTKECTVIDIPFESENEKCYEIELDDGRKCKCAAGHKWRVAWEKDENGDWIWKVVTIEFILEHPELEFEIFEGEYTKYIENMANHISKEC